MGPLFYMSSSSVITLIIVTFFINHHVNKGSVFYQWQNTCLSFILFHLLYIHLIRLFCNGNYYLDAGAPFFLFYGPLYYAALHCIVTADQLNLKKIAAHFYPGLFFTVLFILIAFFCKDNTDLQVLFCRMVSITSGIQIIIYALLSYIKYHRYAREPVSIACMSQSLTLLIAVALLLLSFIFTGPEVIFSYFDGCIIHLSMLSGVWILFRYNLFTMKKITAGHPHIRETDGDEVQEPLNESEVPAEDDPDRTREKYQKSKITEAEIRNYMETVQAAFDQKIYLDPELTLEKLSKAVKIPKYHLTQVFTFGFAMGFNKVINKYRIEYAVSLLEDSAKEMTMEEIGMESGFNSRSSFYRAFNHFYDGSPSQYRDHHQQQKH